MSIFQKEKMERGKAALRHRNNNAIMCHRHGASINGEQVP